MHVDGWANVTSDYSVLSSFRFNVAFTAMWIYFQAVISIVIYGCFLGKILKRLKKKHYDNWVIVRFIKWLPPGFIGNIIHVPQWIVKCTWFCWFGWESLVSKNFVIGAADRVDFNNLSYFWLKVPHVTVPIRGSHGRLSPALTYTFCLKLYSLLEHGK